MARVERFFHIRIPGLMAGGATVRVVGDTDRVGQVDLQVAYCHTKDKNLPEGDTFCKRIGREQATAAPIKVVPLRYLPAELGRVCATIYKRSKLTDLLPLHTDYSFSLKYFLPKE